MKSRLPRYRVYSGARQPGRLLSLWLIITLMGFHSFSSAEGTKQLEPGNAPAKSVCKIVLSQSSVEYRIPFALQNCNEDFRLNVRINDYSSEKIYLGFGDVINYSDKSIVYSDVRFQVKDPAGNSVTGPTLLLLPLPVNAGYISTRNQVDAGPDINNTNAAGYKPLVITPVRNGDYIIEFKIPDASQSGSIINEMRVFKYFDVTVAKGNNPIPGRLWSKAWQLSSGSVIADTSASYSLFHIYTSDSVVTRFDCNGLAGGVWTIYSNEWGCSANGAWTDSRRSVRGNASVKPEYKIFLNDPDSLVFPSGHIGEMINFNIVPNVCDTVITFETDVSKGGNIDIQLDIDPPNPGSFGPEDVQLGYSVKAGHNVLLPAWDGKDGNGIPLANETEVKAKIRFLNGLSNVPLYDVEDNPKGFKVDIERPKPASGSSKLKLFWDDTNLPSQYYPTSNVTYGCLYNGIEPVSGCHNWTRAQNLGDTNTINTWWYLTTDQVLEKTVKLIIRPSSGHITEPVEICKGQSVSFSTTSIAFAQKYIWQLSVPGYSAGIAPDAPDSTFTYYFNKSLPAGQYVISVFGRNTVCGDGNTVFRTIDIHNLPVAAFVHDNPCQGAGITFTDQSTPADANLVQYTWITNSMPGDERSFRGNPAIIVFDTTLNYKVSHIVTDLLGCTDTVSSLLTILPKPASAFTIIENSPINNGELHFDNQTTGAASYSWNFGNDLTSALFEPFIKYDSEGDYTIMLVATNTEGCRDTLTKQYYYMPGFWLPNAFSPDNNGKNDIFRPVTQRNTLAPYQLLIYDRWGQLIFKSSDPSVGWDGTYKDQPCQAGSYSYLLQYRDAKIDSSEIVTLRGMVSLIR